MGVFLDCGIATQIIVMKNGETKKKVLKAFENEIDFNIYNVSEDEKYVFFNIKEKVFEENAIKFIEEQIGKIANKKHCFKEDLEKLKELEGKSYRELMEIADNKKYYLFQMVEGSIVSNDVSYVCDNFVAFADIISYIGDGKVFLECYDNIFYYIRKNIIDSSKNPIRTAAFISMLG